MPEQAPTATQALLLGSIAIGVYVALVVAAKLLHRTRGIRFRWIYHGFAAALGLLLAVQWAVPEFTGRDALRLHLLAATLILAAFPLATLLNHILWSRPKVGQAGRSAPRLLSDTTSVVAVVVMVLIVLQFIYKQEVPGLLAGSGVAAIVLGLAMQDLLANTIAGIALFIEKPFKTGDWLLIDGREARVVEVTWRSVRLLTDEDVFVDVPNSKVVQESIVNFHEPDAIHAVKTSIGLHYDVPPARAIEVLREAAASVRNTCPEPPPRIELMELGDNAVVYEVEVSIDDHGNSRQVLSDLRVHLWYAARRAGMEIPYPQLTIHRARPADTHATARAAAARALAAHPVFGFLAPTQVDALVARSPAMLFAPSERLTLQGQPGGSMYLLTAGEVDVMIEKEGTRTTVATLRAGDCLGEMSVLTGAARTATTLARTEVEAIEISKPAFAELIQDNPDVVARLGELLAQRQLANEKLASTADTAARIEQVRGSMLAKIRGFFQLNS